VTLAEQLLDAQVAWILDQLTGERLAAQVAEDVDTVLAVAGDHPLAELVDVAEVKRVVRRLAGTVPASTGAGALVRRTAEVVHAGADERFSADQLLTREQVEAIVGEVLHSSRLAEKTLDELAQSPLMATVASRFVGRLVGEVLAANKAAASKVPGLGGLVSLGTGAASAVMGAADKQFEALLGGATGKGATFAARRINKIVLETLQDPTTRAAVMQVWDMYSDKPLPPPSAYVRQEDLLRFAEVAQEALATAAASEPAGDLLDALVDGFFAEYGEHPVTTLLEELEITRDDLVADTTSAVGNAASALHEAGALEDVVRRRLAPFFESAEVAALLER
jgi:hypothetical protein